VGNNNNKYIRGIDLALLAYWPNHAIDSLPRQI